MPKKNYKNIAADNPALAFLSDNKKDEESVPDVQHKQDIYDVYDIQSAHNRYDVQASSNENAVNTVI